MTPDWQFPTLRQVAQHAIVPSKLTRMRSTRHRGVQKQYKRRKAPLEARNPVNKSQNASRSKQAPCDKTRETAVVPAAT